MQIHVHNLQPALQWVEEHRQELQKQPQAAGFEFKLYRLSFVNTLQQQGTTHQQLTANDSVAMLLVKRYCVLQQVVVAYGFHHMHVQSCMQISCRHCLLPAAQVLVRKSVWPA